MTKQGLYKVIKRAVPPIHRSLLYLSLVALLFTATGCGSVADSIKTVAKEVVSEVIVIIAIITLAVAIIKPMLLFITRIVVSGLFEEGWQISSVSINMAYAIIGGIVGLFITLNAGTIVDSIVNFVKSLW